MCFEKFSRKSSLKVLGLKFQKSMKNLKNPTFASQTCGEVLDRWNIVFQWVLRFCGSNLTQKPWVFRRLTTYNSLIQAARAKLIFMEIMKSLFASCAQKLHYMILNPSRPTFEFFSVCFDFFLEKSSLKNTGPKFQKSMKISKILLLPSEHVVRS